MAQKKKVKRTPKKKSNGSTNIFENFEKVMNNIQKGMLGKSVKKHDNC